MRADLPAPTLQAAQLSLRETAVLGAVLGLEPLGDPVPFDQPFTGDTCAHDEDRRREGELGEYWAGVEDGEKRVVERHHERPWRQRFCAAATLGLDKREADVAPIGKVPLRGKLLGRDGSAVLQLALSA